MLLSLIEILISQQNKCEPKIEDCISKNIEIIKEKVENAGYWNFLLFPLCSLGSYKVRIV